MPNNEEEQLESEKLRKFFEEEGSSRAVTSGSLAMLFALIGSSCVWFFMILATGWEGLQYFGLTTAINTIVGMFGIGIARNFIAEIKEALVINEELARVKAAAYSKMLLLIGYSLGVVMITLSFFTPNKLLRICYFASGFTTMIGYTSIVFSIGLEIRNRYDITAFLSIFGGVFLLIWAYMFIAFGWNPIYFAFHPFFNITTFILFGYFFHKFAPYSFKDILRGKLSSQKMRENTPQEVQNQIEDKQTLLFLKDSLFSTVTNMESLGIFGNLLIFFAALYLAIFNPEFQSLGVSLLTVLMIYGAVKTVILYYSAPLNIEIAEACIKEKHQIIEDSINNSTRISSILALGFVVGMIALSGELLIMLHSEFFTSNGSFDNELFLLAQTLFIMIIFGQFAYGYATLFGNALIGSGNGRYAAIGFGTTLLIIIGVSPICIFLFGILGVGITMIISIIFLLPYMAIQLKRKLNIKLHFKLGRLAPNLVLLFLIFALIPIKGTTGLVIRIILGGLVYMMLNPFFGVSIEEDLKMYEDIFETLRIKPLGKVIVRLMVFSYNISPFNKDKIDLERENSS